jgi:hypothetical protein
LQVGKEFILAFHLLKRNRIPRNGIGHPLRLTAIKLFLDALIYLAGERFGDSLVARLPKPT